MIACPICLELLKAGRCACPEQPITVRPGNPAALLDFAPCSAWLGELEAALVRIKKRGDDCACTFYGACGCGDACAEIASEALDSIRRNGSNRLVRIQDIPVGALRVNILPDGWALIDPTPTEQAILDLFAKAYRPQNEDATYVVTCQEQYKKTQQHQNNY